MEFLFLHGKLGVLSQNLEVLQHPRLQPRTATGTRHIFDHFGDWFSGWPIKMNLNEGAVLGCSGAVEMHCF